MQLRDSGDGGSPDLFIGRRTQSVRAGTFQGLARNPLYIC